MSGRVIEVDHGWNRIKANLLKADKLMVAVGILGSDANRKQGGELDNVDIGTVHEFGSADGKIPERSFLRATVEKNRNKYVKLSNHIVKLIIKGALDYKAGLNLFGERIKADVINRINAGIEPANADSTVLRKGSSKPLIDTGQLKQSITYEVREGGIK